LYDLCSEEVVALCGIIILLLPAAGMRGQDRPPISVEATIVTFDTTVRDAHGQIVSNLTRDDFALDEDGRPQTITYFARENDLPLTIGLLVDTSLSQRHALDQERKTSYTFLDHTMRPEKDKAFLIHFDREVELLEDVTSSRQKLESALGLLQTPRPTETSEGGEHHRGGGTLLYDAVFLASDEVMKKQQGRKALIVLTDGVDRNSKETLADAIEAAQRANTVVYAALFKGEQPYDEHGGHGGWGMGGHGGGHGGGPRGNPQEEHPDGKKILEKITKETGGRLFDVTKKQPIDDIYAQIEQELRNQYVLGYTPVKASDATDYRKIHVVTKTKGLIVQARDGYYATP
jgi:VWFA-related protein